MEKLYELSKVGEYQLTSQCGETLCEQTIIDYYDKNKQLRTTVLNKETKDTHGNSVRLIGSTLRYKEGYPPLVFDAGIFKVHGKVLTSFSSFLPTVSAEIHIKKFDSEVQKRLSEKKIEFCLLKESAKIPEYLKMLPERFRTCGFNVHREGEHLDLIEELRNMSFDAYEEVLKESISPCRVDEFANYLINEQSKNEHKVFKEFGMSVPSKVQKAFFTLFAEGTEFAK